MMEEDGRGGSSHKGNKLNKLNSGSSSKGTAKPKSAAPGRPKKKKKEEEPDDKKDRPVAVRYHCDYCRKDISNSVRIKCAECQDFDLCIECFSVGVEIGGHKNDHAYFVMDQMKFTLFQADWGADEELLLLEAIEIYGLGNWTDISDHVGTKTLKECEAHYFSLYFDSPYCPLPDMGKAYIVEREPKEVLAQTEWVEPPKPGTSAPVQHEGSGFMPKRGEFDVEYENDAEAPLAEMTITEEDTDAERELKVKVLLAYNQRLDERLKKRRFVIDNLLLDTKPERRWTKDDKPLYNTHRVFLQLWDKTKHDNFLNGLVAERRLMQRIRELQCYRANGIRTLQEAETFETDKKKRSSSSFSSGSSTSSVLAREREREKKSKLSKKMGQPLDLTGTPGVELLSTREQELCSNVRIYPQQYLMIKECMIRECLKSGTLKKATARQLIKIDVNKTARIFDFLEASGVINSPTSSYTLATTKMEQ